MTAAKATPAHTPGDFQPWQEIERLQSERDALSAALAELIRVWEGPRDRAAVGFAAAIVKAREALNKGAK